MNTVFDLLLFLLFELLIFKWNRDYKDRINELPEVFTKPDIPNTNQDSEFKRKINTCDDFYSNEYIEKWERKKIRKSRSASFFYGNKSNLDYLNLDLGLNSTKNLEHINLFSGKFKKFNIATFRNKSVIVLNPPLEILRRKWFSLSK